MKTSMSWLGAAIAAVVLAGGYQASGLEQQPPWEPSTPTRSASASGAAADALADLPVKGRAPMSGYEREQFGQAWSDAARVDGARNGCDTRNDVLRRDLSDVVVKPGTRGCLVLSGTLRSPYSGHEIGFERGEQSGLVQIDHVVPLADAWVKGGQALSADEREDLANDPLNLMAVEGGLNGSKGAGDAATWRPPARSSWCSYAARQIAVKKDYRLWVTAAEKQALLEMLEPCPGQQLPTPASTSIPDLEQ